MPVSLTGFADEISPDLEVQTRTLQELGIRGLDLRSVDGTNVLELSPMQLQNVLDKCHEHGLEVSSIGSPVNKVPYDVLAQSKELEKLRKACHAASLLNCKRVRIFTPETVDADAAPKILEWMAEQRRLAEEYKVILIVENDARYWNAYPENSKKLFETLGSEYFKAAFDFANTVLIGYRPMKDWFPWLLPYLDTLHIKDAVEGENKVVPAGEGEGEIEETLRWLYAQGWDGPLTLEPHLQDAGKFGGFSGADRFGAATQALRDVLVRVGKA
ncbi:sugar phosphate isomerase/epimerase [bacterium]|nr:MAG: sugar phosphate isomerase/epimerase [bacterium]